MKKWINNKYALLGIAIVLGVLIGWLIKPGLSGKAETEIHQHDALESQQWTCSMHPQIRQNEAGKCPLCGMDLIPIENEGEGIDPKAITMSSTAMQLANVQTMVIEGAGTMKTTRLSGKVHEDERLRYTQSSHIPGRIEKLTTNFTGEYISQGQVIAYVYSPELITAQEELFEAMKVKEQHPQLFEAAKKKLISWKLTNDQISEILESDKPIEQFPILSNVSGYVSHKMVNLGDYVKQGQPLYEIADLSRVWVLFDVYESDMHWIKKGDKISFTVASLPGQGFEGNISYIDPAINAKTRVASARIELKNEGNQLKPEMFVSGTIKSELSSDTNTISVPKSAVMWTGKRSLVYIKTTTSQDVSFKMREVSLGAELGQSYIIEKGLAIGDEIAVNGTFSIDAAAQLAGKPSMMNPGDGMSMPLQNHGNKAMDNPTPDMLGNESGRDALLPLFDAYFKLKQALANDDLANSKGAIKELEAAHAKIDASAFSEDGHRFWMEQTSMSTPVLEKLHGSLNIQEIRKNFMPLSGIMINLAQSFQPSTDTLYIQHCPMANSNQGANWLSLDKQIENPYFGASMLKCGSTTKAIP